MSEGHPLETKEIWSAFLPVVADLDEDFDLLLKGRPLLAHYTSTDVLEKILKSEEIWLSNPLFMNDLQELRHGMAIAKDLVNRSEKINKCFGSVERGDLFRHYFEDFYSKFENEHAIDVYVFCFSEHPKNDNDGMLSMWRGYGGNGNGAALVFNTEFVNKAESPLILTKVSYASEESRHGWLEEKLNKMCNLFETLTLPDDKLYYLAHLFFQLVTVFALKFKYVGFKEENEWRVIYLPDRDPKGLLKDGFDYVIGPRGVEPKLRFKIEPLPLIPKATWTFESILDRIILGPTHSSPLAQKSIQKMLGRIGKQSFTPKVVASKIPLRPS